MVLIEFNLLSITFLTLIFCGMLYFIFKDQQSISALKNLFHRPTIHYSTSENIKQLEQVLSLLPALSDAEKEIIIANIWGRPINIMKGRDSSGRTWFEFVQAYKSEGNEDLDYHYQQLKNKNNFG